MQGTDAEQDSGFAREALMAGCAAGVFAIAIMTLNGPRRRRCSSAMAGKRPTWLRFANAMATKPFLPYSAAQRAKPHAPLSPKCPRRRPFHLGPLRNHRVSSFRRLP
jgi:hypothetical protein